MGCIISLLYIDYVKPVAMMFTVSWFRI